MPNSKWSVSSKGIFFHNNQLFNNRPFRIIHLEDHHLFARGLKACILPFFPLAVIINFRDGDEALYFIKNQLMDRVIIDLIITDIHHPGLKGDKFLQEVRLFEKKNNFNRIPALIVTMEESPALMHLTASKQSVADGYLSKATEPEDIINALENILYANKKGR